ncbi:MAG: hypothetical protein Q7U74_02535, partial [Saprospiraceae bacterium]|nr:hypothetical protein [Saprospiraceae bacterium]
KGSGKKSRASARVFFKQIIRGFQGFKGLFAHCVRLSLKIWNPFYVGGSGNVGIKGCLNFHRPLCPEVLLLQPKRVWGVLLGCFALLKTNTIH